MALTQVSTGGIKDGQVQTADLADGQVTVGKLHADALDRTYTLGASGTNHYTFTGEGLTGAVNDPTLYLTRGKTYRFVNGNSAGAHPFRIQTTVNGSAGTEYNTGVTNNGGAGGSTIVFEVPHDAPDVLYYQCTSHGSMGGILYVTGALADGTVTTAKIANDAVTNAKMANNAVDDAVIAALAVTTPKIADQAVTLAKLPHGTSSNDGKFLRANNGADPTFETVSGTTINNNANNRLITGSGTANTLEGESTATYDGTKLFLSGGVGSDGHINMLELKHLNTASSTTNGTGDGPALLLNGYYANNEWAMAKIAADNAGGQFGSGYGGELSFWVHPANGTQTASVIKAADIIGDGTGANLTITDGNLKIGTSGHGIDFSATANGTGSNQAELLDDYEEGEWSPSAPQTSNHSNLGTFRYARYVKIGHVVHLWCDCYQSSNNMEIQNGWELHGFPFSVNANGFLGPALVGTFSYTASQAQYIPNYIDSGSGGYLYVHTHDWTPLRHIWFLYMLQHNSINYGIFRNNRVRQN